MANGNGVSVEVKGKNMIISIPISKYESASGKSTVVATTHGCIETKAKVDGKPVTLNLSAFCKK